MISQGKRPRRPSKVSVVIPINVVTRIMGAVELRIPCGLGVRVITIFTSTPTPRVLAYAESQGERAPLSLYLDEIFDALCEALGEEEAERAWTSALDAGLDGKEER